MKKNFAMRIAACLLMVTMLSLCMVSYTYAKYTTGDTGNDSARVAKWGVVVNLDGFDMFEANYDNTVISANGTDKVVAPGTSATLAGISIKGAPEVKVEVKYEADLKLTGWEIPLTSEYCPLIITVGTEKFYIGKADIDTVAKLELAVEAAINKYTAQYDANVNLATSAETPVVSWEWQYENDLVTSQSDVNDTILGDLAAAGKAPVISLEITTTVTQIN